MANADATPKLDPPADSFAETPQRIDLGEGEDLVLSLKPHWIYILIDRPLVLALSIGTAGAGTQLLEGIAQLASLLIPLAWLVWQLIERASRTYVLTDRRVVMIAGVLRQAIVDAPLANVRQVTVIRSIPERILGLGTVAFATAGTGGQDIIWRVLDRPVDTLRTARDTLDQAEAKP
ncbi:MAG: PH domain-containing protein [Planctomycetota bacterium]